MLILRDTDPSLLCRSLMPGVPETAGKTVCARQSAHTMGSQATAEHFTVVFLKNNTASEEGSKETLRGKCPRTRGFHFS